MSAETARPQSQLPVGDIPYVDPENGLIRHDTDQTTAFDIAVLNRDLGWPVTAGNSTETTSRSRRGLNDMSPEGRAVMARYGLRTSDPDVASPPGSFLEHQLNQEFERAKETIAERTTAIFAQIEPGQTGAELGEAARNGTLGSKLAEVFGSITGGIRAEGVHERRLKQPVFVGDRWIKTKVVADRLTFTTSTLEEAGLLDIALQGLQHDPEAPFSPSIHERIKPTHTIEGSTEWLPRAVNTVISILLEQEEKARRANGEQTAPEEPVVVMPVGPKLSLQELEAVGHMLPRSQTRQRLEQIDREYAALSGGVTATYRDTDGSPMTHYRDTDGNIVELKPRIRKHPSAWDVTAPLGLWRSIFNGLVDPSRGDNILERDPGGDIPIFRGIPLTRDPEAVGAPGAIRLPKYNERFKRQIEEYKIQFKEHRGMTMLKLGSMAVGLALSIVPGFGALTIGTTAASGALSKLPQAVDIARYLPSDMSTYIGAN